MESPVSDFAAVRKVGIVRDVSSRSAVNKDGVFVSVLVGGGSVCGQLWPPLTNKRKDGS